MSLLWLKTQHGQQSARKAFVSIFTIFLCAVFVECLNKIVCVHMQVTSWAWCSWLCLVNTWLNSTCMSLRPYYCLLVTKSQGTLTHWLTLCHAAIPWSVTPFAGSDERLGNFVWCYLFVRDYVRSELESGHEGPVYLEPLSMNRFTTALIGMLLHMNAWRHVCSTHDEARMHRTNN